MGYVNTIKGFMSTTELEVIEKIVEDIPVNGNIIELGALFGRTSVCMAMSVKSGVTIYCLDDFGNDFPVPTDENYQFEENNPTPIPGVNYDIEEEFMKNTKEFSNIIKIKGGFPNNDNIFPLIDMIFLDASHTNPNDWDTLCYYVPLIKLNGLVCGHDYNERFPDVIENVSRLEKFFGVKSKIYENTQIWSINVTKTLESLKIY